MLRYDFVSILCSFPSSSLNFFLFHLKLTNLNWFLAFVAGEIFLMRPLEDIAAITHVGDPVLLTVIAEEVKVGRDEPPAMASTVQLAFFLPDRTNSPPYFENDQ